MNKNTLYVLIWNSLWCYRKANIYKLDISFRFLFYLNSAWMLYSIVYIQFLKKYHFHLSTCPQPNLHVKLTTQKLYWIYSVLPIALLHCPYTPVAQFGKQLPANRLLISSSDNCCLSNIFCLQGLPGSHYHLYTKPPLQVNAGHSIQQFP